MKKCEKCFYSPELCGAKTEDDCKKNYENKWFVYILIIIFLVIFFNVFLYLAPKIFYKWKEIVEFASAIN